MGSIKLFAMNVAKALIGFIYDLTGQKNIIMSIIVLAILVQLFNCLVRCIRRFVSYKINTGKNQSAVFKLLNTGLAIFEFVFTLSVLTGVYFVMGNLGTYFNISGNDLIYVSATVAEKKMYIYPILVVLSQTLPLILSAIQSKKSGKKVSKFVVYLTIYISITLGIASYNMPAGISIYWIVGTLMSTLITSKVTSAVDKVLGKKVKEDMEKNPEKYTRLLEQKKESEYDNKIIRYINAQNNVYVPMSEKLRKGMKIEDELFYVFPMSKELEPENLKEYGIENEYEARSYLKNIIAGKRLRDTCNEIIKHNDIKSLLGENNTKRIKNSLEMFKNSARKDKDKELFDKVLKMCS